MKEIALNSTVLLTCAYDPQRQLLRIRFRTGGLYLYEPVPEDVAHALIRAPSQGQYFNSAIRGKFLCRRLS